MKTTTKSAASSAIEGRLRSLGGKHNPLVKELRRAFVRGEAGEDGSCAIEGFRILEEAIRSGLRFRAVFFSNSAESRAGRLLPQLGAQVQTVLLPDKLFASVVPSETPQGVAALVRCKHFTPEDVLGRAQAGPILVIVGLQDPGNLGTILRSAEAFGAGGVLLAEGTVSAFNSKVVRASAGSIFRLPVAQCRIASVLSVMRDNGLRLVATSSHKGMPPHEARLAGPAAIFIGGEGGGLDKSLLSQMDEVLAIPHAETVESLNAGVAAAIVLYEAAKQRRALPTGNS